MACSVSELARAAIGPTCLEIDYLAMTLTASLLSLVIGATLLGLVTRIVIPPATWLALPLLLHASRSMPAGVGTLSLWIAVYVALVLGNRGILPVGGAPYFAINAVYTTTLVLPFIVDRLVASRTGGLASTLVFPMAFVAAEFLRSRFTPAATWNSLAYTQYRQSAADADRGVRRNLGNQLPARLDRLDGRVGVGPALRVVDHPHTRHDVCGGPWMHRPHRQHPRSDGADRRAVDAGGHVEPTARPLHPRGDDEDRVGPCVVRRAPVFLRQAWSPARLVPGGQPARSACRRPADRLAGAKPAGLRGGRARVPRPGAAARSRGARVSRDGHGHGTRHAVAVREQVGRDRSRRKDPRLVCEEPSGCGLGSHRDAPRRRTSANRRHAEGRLATAICFDADFPEFMRQAGQGGADLLVVPANEWREVKDVHVQMAAFRAIENGVSLVRPAASGLSSAVDPWGRVLGMSDHFSARDGTMIAHVPIGHISTLYATTGDLFAWLCVAGAMAATVFGRGGLA